MSRTVVVGWIVQVTTIVLAFLLAHRRPQQRAFAVWATAVLAQDFARLALDSGPLDAPRPYTGAVRALFHLSQALCLVEPAGLAFVAWKAYALRRPWIPLVAGALVLSALVALYPWLRGERLAATYTAVQAASCAVVVLGFAAWSRRRAPVRPEIATVLFAGALMVALFAGPYAPPLPATWSDWSSAEALYLMIWGGLAAIHAVVLSTGKWLDPAPPRGTMMH